MYPATFETQGGASKMKDKARRHTGGFYDVTVWVCSFNTWFQDVYDNAHGYAVSILQP